MSIGSAPEWKPSPDGAAASLEAVDFDKVIEKVKKAGVLFKVEPQDFPSCHMAVIKDPDGNHLMIHKRK